MHARANLLDFAARVAAKLPQTEADDEFRFLPSSIVDIPEALETDQLIILRGHHDYGSFRVDYPQVYAPKSVYEALGIVSAAILVKPSADRTIIHLTDKRSDIRQLRVEFESPRADSELACGLLEAPVGFVYLPSEVSSKPWLLEDVRDPQDYPHFALTDEGGFPHTDAQRADRDVLCGFGSARGSARIAQLFLDMSRDANAISEFVLESEAGFRGVAPASAEIRFWLPGGHAPEDYFS